MAVKPYSPQVKSSVLSKDGTKIDYLILGQGPGILVLPGSLQTGVDYLALGEQLANCYTVYLVDRRGRNGSGPKGVAYSLQKECEDAIALLTQTQAIYVFGHSYGGLIALNVACQFPVTKLALYEPAVSINGSMPSGWLPTYERQLNKAEYLDALVTMIQGLQLGGRLNWLPTLLFRLLARGFVDQAGLVTMSKLLPTLPAEIRECLRFDSKTAQYTQITAPTLLMVGNESPDYLRQTMETVAAVVPQTQIVRLPGLDHGAPTEAPAQIRPTLQKFFGTGIEV